MLTTLQVFDETTGRGSTQAGALSFSETRVKVRDIIVERVRREAARRNAGATPDSPSLVEPGPVEELLNEPKTGKVIDADRQCDVALKAFRDRAFLVLVDERHLDDLDDEVELQDESRVTFLRLVPLVGG